MLGKRRNTNKRVRNLKKLNGKNDIKTGMKRIKKENKILKKK